jgi:inorganic pyrophosphatase
MAYPRNSHALTFLPARDEDTGDVTVVVETPRGSRNKYRYDPSCGALRLAAVLGEGLAFPYDFGFVPSTLGEDGDPLDVLLFLGDDGVPPGSVVTARLTGVLEVRQRKEGQGWQRNDRFLAAAIHSRAYRGLKDLDDLRPHLLEEVEAFFVTYAGLEGKQLEVLRRSDPDRADELLKAGIEMFRAKGGR